MSRTIALLVEYDGAAYHGFQLQTNAATVQGELEQGLRRLTGEAIRIRSAGRTDAGVHAAGQVVAFETDTDHDAKTFVDGLNWHLPRDIAVRSACQAQPGFDPRRQALSRCYRYAILNRPARVALLRSLVAWVREPLDLAAMDEGARWLIGQHDMASFCGPLNKPGVSTVRTVTHAAVYREGGLILFDIEGNAFLPQQVRRTVGVLLSIGKGEGAPDLVRALLDRPQPGRASYAAPPHGLCLMEVTYPAGLLEFSDTRQATLQFVAVG